MNDDTRDGQREASQLPPLPEMWPGEHAYRRRLDESLAARYSSPAEMEAAGKRSWSKVMNLFEKPSDQSEQGETIMNDDTRDDLDAILADPDALPGASEPLLVLATNWELLDVLEGRELTFSAGDGSKVRIRLYNTDELLRAQRAAALTLEAETGVPDPGMTRAKAIELCRPLSEILRHARRTP